MPRKTLVRLVVALVLCVVVVAVSATTDYRGIVALCACFRIIAEVARSLTDD